MIWWFSPKENEASVYTVITTLKQFEQVFGLAINPSKSKLFNNGLKEEILNSIIALTDFPVGEFPVRYLGVLLAASRLKTTHYAPLIDKVADFINVRTTNSLSHAGRLEHIKYVAQGVESFWLQAFCIRNNVIDKIVRFCRVFLWAGRRLKVSLKDVCLPKEEVGLGIINCKH